MAVPDADAPLMFRQQDTFRGGSTAQGRKEEVMELYHPQSLTLVISALDTQTLPRNFPDLHASGNLLSLAPTRESRAIRLVGLQHGRSLPLLQGSLSCPGAALSRAHQYRSMSIR